MKKNELINIFIHSFCHTTIASMAKMFFYFTKTPKPIQGDKKAAFSLVEILVSLIVISVLLAAFVPVITKKLHSRDITIGAKTEEAEKEYIYPEKQEDCPDYTLFVLRGDDVKGENGLPAGYCVTKWNLGDDGPLESNNPDFRLGSTALPTTVRLNTTSLEYDPEGTELTVYAEAAGVSGSCNAGSQSDSTTDFTTGNKLCCWNSGVTSGGYETTFGTSTYSGGERTICTWHAAVALCENWAPEGFKKGDWSLPTVAQLNYWSTNISSINTNKGSDGLQLCDINSGYGATYCKYRVSACLGAHGNYCYPYDLWSKDVASASYARRLGLDSNVLREDSTPGYTSAPMSARCIAEKVPKKIKAEADYASAHINRLQTTDNISRQELKLDEDLASRLKSVKIVDIYSAGGDGGKGKFEINTVKTNQKPHQDNHCPVYTKFIKTGTEDGKDVGYCMFKYNYGDGDNKLPNGTDTGTAADPKTISGYPKQNIIESGYSILNLPKAENGEYATLYYSDTNGDGKINTLDTPTNYTIYSLKIASNSSSYKCTLNSSTDTTQPFTGGGTCCWGGYTYDDFLDVNDIRTATYTHKYIGNTSIPGYSYTDNCDPSVEKCGGYDASTYAGKARTVCTWQAAHVLCNSFSQTATHNWSLPTAEELTNLRSTPSSNTSSLKDYLNTSSNGLQLCDWYGGVSLTSYPGSYYSVRCKTGSGDSRGCNTDYSTSVEGCEPRNIWTSTVTSGKVASFFLADGSFQRTDVDIRQYSNASVRCVTHSVDTISDIKYTGGGGASGQHASDIEIPMDIITSAIGGKIVLDRNYQYVPGVPFEVYSAVLVYDSSDNLVWGYRIIKGQDGGMTTGGVGNSENVGCFKFDKSVSNWINASCDAGVSGNNAAGCEKSKLNASAAEYGYDDTGSCTISINGGKGADYKGYRGGAAIRETSSTGNDGSGWATGGSGAYCYNNDGSLKQNCKVGKGGIGYINLEYTVVE